MGRSGRESRRTGAGGGGKEEENGRRERKKGQEAGEEERARGGTRVGSRTNWGKLRNNASYFAIDIGPNGESRRKNGGSRECKVWGAEGLDSLSLPRRVFLPNNQREYENFSTIYGALSK